MGKSFKQNSLIIFVKNPHLGSVKSRLAKTLGESKALAIYLKLIQHTRLVTENLDCTKAVYYSDYIDSEDGWENNLFKKSQQKGNDLGERMLHAFDEQFNKGFQKVCIIGSDNPEISEAIINEAYLQLENHDVVIGPASDGGYYLLGLNKIQPKIFINKQWSTNRVLPDTVQILDGLKLSYFMLPTLSDIDTEEDLRNNKNKSEWMGS